MVFAIFAGWWMTVFTLGAQAISGTLKDNNNAPLSYANVVVMTTDSFCGWRGK